LGNALVLVVFLDRPLDGVFFLHDAGEANYVPANAITFAAPAKKICRRGDHKRGIRRTEDQARAGCQYEIGINDSASRGIAPNLFYRWEDEAEQGAKAALGGRSAAAAETENFIMKSLGDGRIEVL
jgi:hypothetical protein